MSIISIHVFPSNVIQCLACQNIEYILAYWPSSANARCLPLIWKRTHSSYNTVCFYVYQIPIQSWYNPLFALRFFDSFLRPLSSAPTSKAQMPPPRLPLPSTKDTTHSASRCTNSVLKRKFKTASKKTQGPKKNILSNGRKDENGTRHQGYKLAVVPILKKMIPSRSPNNAALLARSRYDSMTQQDGKMEGVSPEIHKVDTNNKWSSDRQVCPAHARSLAQQGFIIMW